MHYLLGHKQPRERSREQKEGETLEPCGLCARLGAEGGQGRAVILAPHRPPPCLPTSPLYLTVTGMSVGM